MDEIQLIAKWRENIDHPDGLYLDDDREILSLQKTCEFRTYESFYQSDDFEDYSSVFHLGLVPAPYIGDILNAEIYIMMLNPGFGLLDYYLEERDTDFRRQLLNNLRQINFDIDYPLFMLKPEYLYSGGGDYWYSKLKDIISRLKFAGSLHQRLSYLSKKLAVLELYPYHSQSFKTSAMIRRLPSATYMLDFVHNFILPRARKKEALVICTRSVKDWKLDKVDYDNIVIYGSSEARSAHLTAESRGGRAIINFIRENRTTDRAN